MRKLFTLTLSVIMLFSISMFIACGGVENSSSSSNGTVKPPIVDSSNSSSSNPSSGSSSKDSSSNGTQTPELTLSKISQTKTNIDENPSGIEVAFQGVVVGFDSMGYAHVGDETGIIYVRAKHSNLTLGSFVKYPA